MAHSVAESKNELRNFRNSKYVQSNMEDIFETINTYLKKKQYVCFSGTPCQVDAVKKTFNNNKNLLLVDVMCRGVISPLILTKYLEMQKASYSAEPIEVRFRDKYFGYHYSVMSIIFNDNKEYHRGLRYDPYLRTFFEDTFNRKSCYDCPYRTSNRVGDITIWDAWNIKSSRKLINDDLGATKILVSSSVGGAVIHACEKYLVCEEYLLEDMYQKNNNFKIELNDSSRRKQFFMDCKDLSGIDLFSKYFPITLKIKLRSDIKTMSYKIWRRVDGFKRLL